MALHGLGNALHFVQPQPETRVLPYVGEVGGDKGLEQVIPQMVVDACATVDDFHPQLSQGLNRFDVQPEFDEALFGMAQGVRQQLVDGFVKQFWVSVYRF